MKGYKNIGRIICIIGCLCLLCQTLWAKEPRAYMLGGGNTNFSNRKPDRNGLLTGTYSQEHHLFGVYADGAYSAFFSDLPIAQIDKGFGYGGGICYEYQRYYFKMQLGFGLRYQDVTNLVAETMFTDDEVQDARGYPYHLHYHFYDRVDHATNLHMQMPILFGAGYNNWYFLAGVKLNMTLAHIGRTDMYASGTTAGTYDQYLGYFYEMDNHGLRKNVPIECHSRCLKLKKDVLASFETGYEYAKNFKYGTRYTPKKGTIHSEYRLRIAAFVDYGLLNIMPDTDNPLYHIPEDFKWDFPTYSANHVFSSHEALGQSLHNFYAGIKLTVLFGFYIDHPCRLCGDYTTEVWMSSSQIRARRYRTNGNGK